MVYKKRDVFYCFAKWFDHENEDREVGYDKDNEDMPWSWAEYGAKGHQKEMHGVVQVKSPHKVVNACT